MSWRARALRIHRQAEPHEISSRFLKLASALLSCGMFSLMMSLLVDCYLITQIVLKRSAWSLERQTV